MLHEFTAEQAKHPRLQTIAARVQEIVRQNGFPDAVGTYLIGEGALGVGARVGEIRVGLKINAAEVDLSGDDIVSEAADWILKSLAWRTAEARA